MTRAVLDGGRILLYSVFAEKERCKSIPGGRWNRNERAWEFALSPHVARNIAAVFGDGVLDASLRNLLAPVNDNVTLPDMRLSLWNHQREAVERAANLNGYYLGFDMGTGKTLASITLCDLWGAQQVLILCPKSVVAVWPAELVKHSLRRWAPIPLGEGTVAKRTKRADQAVALAHARGEPSATIINYAAMIRPEFRRWAESQAWDVLIADEIHHLKAPGGVQSRTAASIAKRAKRRLGLSGTPFPHSPLDIYAQARMIDAGVFGTSFTRFRGRYAIMGGYHGYEVKGFQNLDDLHERFFSFASVVKKRDVIDLPPVVFEDRYCTLSSEERRVYEDLESAFFAWVKKGGAEVTVSNALVKLLRLQQVSSGYVMTDDGDLTRLGNSKLEAYSEWLQDVPVSEPVVVFCRFVEDISQLAYHAREAGRSVGMLCGGQNDLAAFQDGEVDTLICQIQAGAEGIDLTRSALCVFFSVGFSLGRYDQALARVDRPGQTRPVTYVRFIAQNTVDERCYQSLAAKRDVIAELLSKKP